MLNQTMLIKTFQWFLNAALVILGIILSVIMVRELITIASGAFADSVNIHDLLQNVLIFFLLFAFVSTTVKYFKEGYHFPIRYLLYIGITATLRFIIVNRENVMENVALSVVILILIISYHINSRSLQSNN